MKASLNTHRSTATGRGNRFFRGCAAAVLGAVGATGLWQATAPVRGAWLVRRLADEGADRNVVVTPAQFAALAAVDAAGLQALVATAAHSEARIARAARDAIERNLDPGNAQPSIDVLSDASTVAYLITLAAEVRAATPSMAVEDRAWARRVARRLADLAARLPAQAAADVLADVDATLRHTGPDAPWPENASRRQPSGSRPRPVLAPRAPRGLEGIGLADDGALGATPLPNAAASPDRLAALRPLPPAPRGDASDAMIDDQTFPETPAIPLAPLPPAPSSVSGQSWRARSRAAPTTPVPEALPITPTEPAEAPLPTPALAADGPTAAGEAPLRIIDVPAPDELRRLRRSQRTWSTAELRTALEDAPRWEAVLIREILAERRGSATASSDAPAATAALHAQLDALERSPSPQARRILRTLVEASDASVRYRALQLLAVSGDPQLVEIASRRQGQDQDPQVLELANRIMAETSR
jgi:hypothetical protein